jgi:hypothetical protein
VRSRRGSSDRNFLHTATYDPVAAAAAAVWRNEPQQQRYGQKFEIDLECQKPETSRETVEA